MITITVFPATNGPLLRAAQIVRGVVYRHDELEVAEKIGPDGRYVDQNDRWSIHILARLSDGTPIGSFKVTPRSPERPMKLESDVLAHVLNVQEHVPCVEMGRLAVLSEYRNQGVALGLWQAAFWETRRLGFEYIYALQRDDPLRMQVRLGIPVERLSKPVVGQNKLLLTPTRIPVATLVDGMLGVNPALAMFFDQPTPPTFDSRAVMNPPAAQLAEFMANQTMFHAAS